MLVAGERQVKNIARPVRVFRLRRERQGGASPTPAQAEVLPLPSKLSVAVLPFTNMSGELEQEYFLDGITGQTISVNGGWSAHGGAGPRPSGLVAARILV